MKWLKVGAVIFGALAITALGIDAADTINGSRSTLLGELISSQPARVCPNGMVEAPMAQTFTCVDRFEASADAQCPHADPQNELETRDNLGQPQCKAASAESKVPWRFVTREQAATACMKAGKRLPESDEWYLMSVGTPDDPLKCNTDSNGLGETGAHQSCASAIGAQDAVGNVWEWVSDDVIDGQFQGRSLPASGYVTQVDQRGIATLTNIGESSDIFYKDYFWSAENKGAYGMIRGGYYGSKADAGVYSTHADTVPTAAGTAIGFRCVK